MKSPLRVLLVVSLLGNAVLAWRVFDLGVTTSYGSDEIARRNRQAAEAQKLLPFLLSGTPRTAVLQAAHRAGLEVLDKNEEGLYAGSIQFVFSEDRLVSVKFE